MKNLANCTPTEFFKQTYLIKKSVAEWIDVTDFMNIRNNKPDIIPLTGLTGEAREKVEAENKKKIQEQVMKNLNDILDNALEKNVEKTLEVLALCCFVEPKDVDKYPVSEYLKSITELLNDENVMGFFTLLAQLGTKTTANIQKR